MRSSLVLATLIALSSVPAMAEETASATVLAKAGQTLRDANMARLGTIDRVYPDGSVQIIFSSHFATIPGSSISVADGVVKTSLTRKEVSKLR